MIDRRKYSTYQYKKYINKIPNNDYHLTIISQWKPFIFTPQLQYSITLTIDTFFPYNQVRNPIEFIQGNNDKHSTGRDSNQHPFAPVPFREQGGWDCRLASSLATSIEWRSIGFENRPGNGHWPYFFSPFLSTPIPPPRVRLPRGLLSIITDNPRC